MGRDPIACDIYGFFAFRHVNYETATRRPRRDLIMLISTAGYDGGQRKPFSFSVTILQVTIPVNFSGHSPKHVYEESSDTRKD